MEKSFHELSIETETYICSFCGKEFATKWVSHGISRLATTVTNCSAHGVVYARRRFQTAVITRGT